MLMPAVSLVWLAAILYITDNIMNATSGDRFWDLYSSIAVDRFARASVVGLTD